MKISKIYSTPTLHYNNNSNVNSNSAGISQHCATNENGIGNVFYNDVKILRIPRTITFMGATVHIVDGGNHATNMQHFANAISKNMDIEMHDVEVNKQSQNTKQLRSLEEQLKYLNGRGSLAGEYIAVPALASVPILNMQDQYNRVMGENKKFTPENLKVNKGNLLLFLKKIYDSPSLYREYIGYMDPTKQGIEYAYGVIQEINKLKNNGARVYIPSGHPHDETLKWMAKDRGYNAELYHYIATGKDIGGCVHDMNEEIKKKNWYSFNLLSLSDANVVGVKGVKGALDYMFAAYDSCVTDGMRGVYNFTPVRINGKLVGYSYTDKTTNEYPYDEFPANDEIANLVKFVGKPYCSVVASAGETAKLKRTINSGLSKANCADKLYSVDDLFTQDEIISKKMNLKGRYVDKTLKTFFDINEDGEVIFPKCDCEGSGKPSVLSMWGSCFATMNAIARDIKLSQKAVSSSTLDKHIQRLEGLKRAAQSYKSQAKLKRAEDALNYAIETDKAFSITHPDYYLDFEPHYLLGNLHYDNAKYDYSAACFNNAVNFLSKFIYEGKQTDLQQIKSKYEEYISSMKNSDDYDMELRRYENMSSLKQFFLSYPDKPLNYGDYKKHLGDYKLYKDVMKIAEMFDKLGNICRNKGEWYPARICKAVANDIQCCNNRGNKVLELRSQGVHYLGNLYPEITES